MPKKDFSHIDSSGKPKMVDISEKLTTYREAEASATVELPFDFREYESNDDIKSPNASKEIHEAFHFCPTLEQAEELARRLTTIYHFNLAIFEVNIKKAYKGLHYKSQMAGTQALVATECEWNGNVIEIINRKEEKHQCVPKFKKIKQ